MNCTRDNFILHIYKYCTLCAPCCLLCQTYIRHSYGSETEILSLRDNYLNVNRCACISKHYRRFALTHDINPSTPLLLVTQSCGFVVLSCIGWVSYCLTSQHFKDVHWFDALLFSACPWQIFRWMNPPFCLMKTVLFFNYDRSACSRQGIWWNSVSVFRCSILFCALIFLSQTYFAFAWVFSVR